MDSCMYNTIQNLGDSLTVVYMEWIRWLEHNNNIMLTLITESHEIEYSYIIYNGMESHGFVQNLN